MLVYQLYSISLGRVVHWRVLKLGSLEGFSWILPWGDFIRGCWGAVDKSSGRLSLATLFNNIFSLIVSYRLNGLWM